jgi:hypothetical protein
LTSASGGRDHTPSPSAPMVLVLHHHRVHRIPSHDRDDAFAPLAEAGRPDHASDLGAASSLFLKNGMKPLRQTGTTGNLRMARMRNLPVGQRASCAGSRAARSRHGIGEMQSSSPVSRTRGSGDGRRRTSSWVISVACAALPAFPLCTPKADTQPIAGVRRHGP